MISATADMTDCGQKVDPGWISNNHLKIFCWCGWLKMLLK